MLRSNLIRKMSQINQFAIRKDLPFEHLFDFSELNVYDSKVINLSAGTPGKSLLMSCCENFQTATKHRMVRIRNVDTSWTLHLLLSNLKVNRSSQ